MTLTRRGAPPRRGHAWRPASADPLRRGPATGRFRLVPPLPADAPRQTPALLAATLAMAGFYLVVGAWLTFDLRLYNVEAMGRTVDAWQVFKGGNWDTVAFSLLLPPLPTVLRVPLGALPLLRADGFAGNVLTALAGAAAFLALGRILIQLGTPPPARLILLTAFAVNPLVWLYGANGASDLVYVALILWSVDQALSLAALPSASAGLPGGPSALERQTPVQQIIVMGFCAGFAALTKWSGLAFILLWGVVIVVLATRARTGSLGLQSVAILYALPPAFAIGLWVLGATLLAGNPLYPLLHLDQAAVRSGVADPTLARELGVAIRIATPFDLVAGLGGLLALTQPVALVLLAVLGVAALTGDRSAAILAAATATQVVALLLGVTVRRAPFALADLLLLTPLSLAAIGWLTVKLTAARRSGHTVFAPRLAAILALALALPGPILAAVAMRQADEPGQWPRQFLGAITGAVTGSGGKPDVWRPQRELAVGLGRLEGKVLLDDLAGYRFVFLSGRPDRFVTRADTEFEQAVQSPVGLVSHLLVPAAGLATPADLITEAWPNLPVSGAVWATPAPGWPTAGWQLFRITRGTAG
ncbi:MAG: hypothetical protein U0556_13020 [Dehalococcoidia bacterium]